MSAEKIGSPSFILSPSPIGFQKSVGSHPGASGAQLRGVAIHHPHPNPQLKERIRVSALLIALLTLLLILLLSLYASVLFIFPSCVFEKFVSDYKTV